MDLVFKALADPTRRELLDELFAEDGQPLNALTKRFAMTRIGVAKHLRVLEDAGLVVCKRRGREKLHYLNPVPIREVHDRWVSKYAEGWTGGLVELKHDLERTMEKVFEIYIRTTPERLWQAITDPEIRSKYHFGSRIESDFTPGSRFEMVNPAADALLGEGENLEVDPPRRLVQSMRALWGPEVISQGTSRVTWEIEPVGDSCRLTVTHDQLRDGANEQLFGGWPMILSGLKTWLETGELLTTPGSLMYAPDQTAASGMTETTLDDVRTVAVTVADQDRAIEFYVGQLGFEIRTDTPIGEGLRWVEVAPPGARVSIALSGGREHSAGPTDSGIRLTTNDVASQHASMRERGVDVGAVLRWPGVPAMFTFRDIDDNTLYVVEDTST